MDPKEREFLESRGWKVGTPSDLLGLSPEDEAWISLRLALVQAVKDARKKRGWTQAQLASAMHSGQARVSKMEYGDPACSTDLYLKALFVMGISVREIGERLVA